MAERMSWVPVVCVVEISTIYVDSTYLGELRLRGWSTVRARDSCSAPQSHPPPEKLFFCVSRRTNIGAKLVILLFVCKKIVRSSRAREKNSLHMQFGNRTLVLHVGCSSSYSV
jgi:hypothetical protein